MLGLVVRSKELSSDLYGHVGRAIAHCRTEAGLTQAEVAAAIGLTRTSVSNIEKGRQKMLLHTLVEIAESLSVPVMSLLPSNDGADAGSSFAFTGSAVSRAERATISAILGATASRREHAT
jgi:DNA-binding XRE family transcriptional regulator